MESKKYGTSDQNTNDHILLSYTLKLINSLTVKDIQKIGINKDKNHNINDLFKSKNDESGGTDILKHSGDCNAFIYKFATIKNKKPIMSQK